MIKKATIKDINLIMEIIKEAVIDMEAQGILQWDHIYPNEKVINQDICEGNLYTYSEENIVNGFIVLNEFQDKEYETINWKYDTYKNLIIHRLCVSPKYKGRGIGTALIKYAEVFGKDNKYEAIRLDSFINNSNACKLYAKNGYEQRGIVNFRKGEFWCLEKKLEIDDGEVCKNLFLRDASRKR